MAVGWGAKCAKILLIVFNLIFWLMGIGLLIFGVWVLVDPQRSYLLDLVNFSEQGIIHPLLKIAAYIFIGVGCLIVVIGFLGCCGALKEVQCMLCTYVIFLSLILCAELAAGVLAVVFKDKFTSNYMQDYLYNKTHNLYGRQDWVTDVVDTVQYYQGCCGSDGPSDWNGSYWQNLQKDRLVPESCCTQMAEATPRQLVPRSAVRCQELAEDVSGQWRHNQGCHEKLLEWFEHHAIIFIALGISFPVFQLFGIMFAICLCRSVGEEL